GVWIIRKRDVILVLEIYQPRHRIGTRRIHAYLTVVIDGHERESGVDRRVRDSNVQMIDGIDWLPVRFGGTTEWVNTQLQASAADRVHVDNVSQILDIGQNEILLVGCVSFDRRGEWHALNGGPVA